MVHILLYLIIADNPDNKILSNIKKFLTWYNSNKFQCDISLFGDGWVDTPLFESVMSALYVSFKGSLFVPKQIFIPIPVQRFQSADCIEYLTHIYQVFKDFCEIALCCKRSKPS